MSKQDKLYIARYNDFYGAMLTPHQKEMISLYYDYDISLFEIAEQFNISRQAVRDTILRAEQILVKYESELKLFDKSSKLNELFESIKGKLNDSEFSKIESELSKMRGILEE